MPDDSLREQIGQWYDKLPKRMHRPTTGQRLLTVSVSELVLLIEQDRLEQRIEELRMILAWHGSKLPADVVNDLRERKVELERQKAGDAS